MEAAIFFDSYLPDALWQAREYAGDDGFVASMPQLLRARTSADYDNVIWNRWFTPYTEESVVTTPQGHPVLVTVHGGGIFASPERYRKLFHTDTSRHSEVGFTGLFAAKITAQEVHGVLEGKLPGNTEFPVFSFDEFKRGVSDLPRRYAVVMDFDTAKNCRCGYEAIDDLKDDPLMIVRAGGAEAAVTYLNKARERHNTATMGSWHPFDRVDPSQPQTRVPTLAGNNGGTGTEDDDGHLYGYNTEYGMGGDSSIHNTSMINIACYVAVAPRLASTSVRHLPFTA